MGSEMVPGEPKRAPKTLLGPFGPILAYFLGGGRPEIFLSPFWAKIGEIFFSKIFFLHYFDFQRVWDPQKPKIAPLYPPMVPK